MSVDGKNIPIVYPTQAWEIHPTRKWEGARAGALTGGAVAGDYCYLYSRDDNDNIICQEVLVAKGTGGAEASNFEKPSPESWAFVKQGEAKLIQDRNGTSLKSQAPVAVAAADDTIYFFYNEVSGEDFHIYHMRYNGTNGYSSMGRLFINQFVMDHSAPAVAINPYIDSGEFGAAMLIWPGRGNNGYFYNTGKFGASDGYGPPLEWQTDLPWNGLAAQVPGTATLNLKNLYGGPTVCGIAPYCYDDKRGYILLLEYFVNEPRSQNSFFGYMIYDAINKTFSPSAPILVDVESGEVANGFCGLASIEPRDKLLIPVLFDRFGNTMNFEFATSGESLGRFGEWQQNSFLTGGGGSSVHASVGIPPSISISATIPASDTFYLNGVTIVSSKEKGGAALGGILNWPSFGDNEVSFGAVCLNYEVSTT